MTKLALTVALALFAVPASAQGVRGPSTLRPDVIATVGPNAAIGVVTWEVFRIPWRAVVQRLDVMVGTGSGGGAGSSIFRVTDGTNNCDGTLLCTASSNANTPQAVTMSGSCSFAPGATITIQGIQSSCTTTQPTVRHMVFSGLVAR